jgi:hypothetical protein
MRHLFFALFIFTCEYNIILSQGEYCEKLLDESDYFKSVEDVINCYTDVGNYSKALEHIDKLIYEYELLLTPPTRFSEEEVYLDFIDIQGLISEQLLHKYYILLDVGEISEDQILQPLNEAIDRLNTIVYPGDNGIELYNKLVLLDAVEDNYDDWRFGRTDVTQKVYYDVLTEKLSYPYTFEEFLLEYPTGISPAHLGKKMRVHFELVRTLIAKARFMLSTANNESQIMEALTPLELAKTKEWSMQNAQVSYWIGITHLLAKNQTLGCSAIQEACKEYKNNPHYPPDWSLLSELTQSCSDCDCD